VSRALKGRNGGIPDVYRRQADIDRGREGERAVGREGGGRGEREREKKKARQGDRQAAAYEEEDTCMSQTH